MSRALYASALPLSTFDREEWQTFFNAIRPTFRIPSRDAFSNRLLDANYREVREQVNDDLDNAQAIALVVDGSEDITSTPIVNIIACTPTPYFIESIATGENSKTGSFLSDLVTPAIEDLGVDKVTAIICDQGSNMANMFHELEKKFPKLIFVNCAAHSLNNLIKDIANHGGFDRVDEVMVIVNQIIREITSSGKKKSNFRKTKSQFHGCSSLRTYSLTR